MVDVGGSVGSVTFIVLEENPHLKFIVQDLEKVIKNDAEKASGVLMHSDEEINLSVQFWEIKKPDAKRNGRVQLQGLSIRLMSTSPGQY